MQKVDAAQRTTDKYAHRQLQWHINHLDSVAGAKEVNQHPTQAPSKRPAASC
jgi:hypothetical protein